MTPCVNYRTTSWIEYQISLTFETQFSNIHLSIVWKFYQLFTRVWVISTKFYDNRIPNLMSSVRLYVMQERFVVVRTAEKWMEVLSAAPVVVRRLICLLLLNLLDCYSVMFFNKEKMCSIAEIPSQRDFFFHQSIISFIHKKLGGDVRFLSCFFIYEYWNLVYLLAIIIGLLTSRSPACI